MKEILKDMMVSYRVRITIPIHIRNQISGCGYVLYYL